ncbi:MAG: cytochrome c family protein [Pseudomonadota bacterium]
MSGFELNKIAASILLASLIAMIVGTVVNILYKPNLSPEQRGYTVDTHGIHVEGSTASAAPEAPIDIAALMKTANASAGENIIKKCLACHSVDKDGPNKVGPHLWNVIGRDKGSIADYKYSAAMMAKGGKWEYADLFAFLKNPRAYLPGTKMSFAGLSKPEDIANVVEFLRLNAHDAPPPALP